MDPNSLQQSLASLLAAGNGASQEILATFVEQCGAAPAAAAAARAQPQPPSRINSWTPSTNPPSRANSLTSGGKLPPRAGSQELANPPSWLNSQHSERTPQRVTKTNSTTSISTDDSAGRRLLPTPTQQSSQSLPTPAVGLTTENMVFVTAGLIQALVNSNQALVNSNKAMMENVVQDLADQFKAAVHDVFQVRFEGNPMFVPVL